jgi:hypothetical protein
MDPPGDRPAICEHVLGDGTALAEVRARVETDAGGGAPGGHLHFEAENRFEIPAGNQTEPGQGV